MSREVIFATLFIIVFGLGPGMYAFLHYRRKP